jgi:hypothetical protein
MTLICISPSFESNDDARRGDAVRSILTAAFPAGIRSNCGTGLRRTRRAAEPEHRATWQH